MIMKSLEKGATLSLTRENPSLSQVAVSLTSKSGSDKSLLPHLTYAALLTNDHGVLTADENMVFAAQPVSPDGSTSLVTDDTIETRLPFVEDSVKHILYLVYLDLPYGMKRTLRQLQTISFEVKDAATGRSLCSSGNLVQSLSGEIALLLGELYRYKDEWKFRVLVDGYATELPETLDRLRGVA